MIERILPATVASAEVFGEDSTARLLAEEEVLVARSVERRRREVTIARTCARRALGEFGHAEVAIPRGPQREPLWPDGVVGSITHCKGYCAAAVAERAVVGTVGIDVEEAGALPHGVLHQVSSPGERELLAELPDAVHGDRLLFSAKESVYKAWFPLTGRWLGFEDAFVRIDPAHGTFRADLLVDPPTVDGTRLSAFTGRFLVEQGLVLTAIAGVAGTSFPSTATP